MKGLKARFRFALLMSTLFVSACSRQKCYQCYEFSGYFYAIKNSDTVLATNFTSGTALEAALNSYRSNGYTVDTIYGPGYIHDYYQGGVYGSCGNNFAYPPLFDSCNIYYSK